MPVEYSIALDDPRQTPGLNGRSTYGLPLLSRGTPMREEAPLKKKEGASSPFAVPSFEGGTAVTMPADAGTPPASMLVWPAELSAQFASIASELAARQADADLRVSD